MVRWPAYVLIVLWLSIFSFIVIAAADDVILTVEGPGNNDPVTLSEKQIRQLPRTSYLTYDPWDKQEREYTGIPLLALLNHINRLDGVTIVDLIARNNYKVKIRIEDLQLYGHILSYEMDGEDYSVLKDDNKGPLAVAVKMEGVDEGDMLRIKNQFVWWLERVVLK
jgi:hypothetical protein